MTEKQWVELMRDRISASCVGQSPALSVHVGMKLPYGYEIIGYDGEPADKPLKPRNKHRDFETDLVIVQSAANQTWKPRIVIEAKINSINTHDAITYSHKAALHKSVHPYLRYGVILGNRKMLPLPGRLYRHGSFFDFMMSFVSFQPTDVEMAQLTRLIKHEIEASRKLESIIYDSRKRDRARYTVLHRQLHLQ